MRAIRVANRDEATALAARINASHGYPRCDRLARALTSDGHPSVVATCTCRDANAPMPGCLLSTRAETNPIELADRSFALPVRETEARTLSALDVAERDAIVTLRDDEMKREVPVADLAVESIRKGR